MPKASKQTASQTESMEGFEGHYEHCESRIRFTRERSLVRNQPRP
jgi:hypothetical protein